MEMGANWTAGLSIGVIVRHRHIFRWSENQAVPGRSSRLLPSGVPDRALPMAGDKLGMALIANYEQMLNRIASTDSGKFVFRELSLLLGVIAACRSGTAPNSRVCDRQRANRAN